MKQPIKTKGFRKMDENSMKKFMEEQIRIMCLNDCPNIQ
jgi:hypothetical protein